MRGSSPRMTPNLLRAPSLTDSIFKQPMLRCPYSLRRGTRLLPVFRFPKRGMERREAPGAGEAPLGGPCDRPACAPCEGARPRSKRRLRLPALHHHRGGISPRIGPRRMREAASGLASFASPVTPPPHEARRGRRQGKSRLSCDRNIVKRHAKPVRWRRDLTVNTS
jgi:hypothetical protein